MATPETFDDPKGDRILDRILSSVEGMSTREALNRRYQESILWLNAMAWHRQQQMAGVPGAADSYLVAKMTHGEIERSIQYLESLVIIEERSATRELRLRIVTDQAIGTHTIGAPTETDTSPNAE